MIPFELRDLPNGVSRVVTKMRNGQNVKFAFIGDSILAGQIADNIGTNDCASLICSELGTKYGVTITKSNRATGGRTAGWFMAEGRFASSLADAADCYFISFGHNDIKSDINQPGIGYPLNASMASIEYMIRRIRKTLPGSDIVVMGENPYAVGNSANTQLTAYNKSLKALALNYGCQWVDGYSVFSKFGDWSSYMADTGHPNTAGHRLLANELKKPFNKVDNYISLDPVVPTVPLYSGVKSYDPLNWRHFTSSGRTAGQDGWYATSFAGTLPCNSSTPGASITANFMGTECLLELNCGVGAGVCTINLDGVDVYANLDLTDVTKYPTGTFEIPLTGLDWGLHVVKLVVVSGTITFGGMYTLHAPTGWINNDSPRFTFTGSWGSGSGDFYASTRQGTSTNGDSFAFTFVGTGFGINVYKRTTDATLTVTIDGVAQTAINVGTAPSGATWAGKQLFKGLTYGKHVVSVVVSGLSGSFLLGGVYTFDESRIYHPNTQRGYVKVGEVITYPVPFAAAPVLCLTGNGVYPTNDTATGFTASGTSGQFATWQAEGDPLVY